MFSPEEQARIERTAQLQAQAQFWRLLVTSDSEADWDGARYCEWVPSLKLTRDDRLFLKQLHISAE